MDKKPFLYIEELESALIDLVINEEVNDLLTWKLDMSNERASEIVTLVKQTVLPKYCKRHNIESL